MKTHQFFLVSTPIGNLGDISARAVETLKSVDLILAEDTRKAKVLLGRYDINTPVRSYHDHNKERVTPNVIRRIECGERIALVADAGTPLISDPGYYLVKRLIDKGFSVTALPGACAAIQALVLSGFPPDRFTFYGYVPRKKGEKEKIFREAGENVGTSIFFESPHRLLKTLQMLNRELGDREIAIARELTKLHEEVIRGKASDLIERIGEYGAKGEITLLIRGKGRRRSGVTP